MGKLKMCAAAILALSMAAGVHISAEECIDADYSAALITAMGQGLTPEETVLEGLEGPQVQEVTTDKISYTTDVLTVRTNPGTEYEELSKLSMFSQIQVVGVCDNGWSHVVMQDGTSGYVCNDYLSDVVPEGAENIGESLGIFTVTYYCSCGICCGWWSGSPTASGAYPTPDWTVAADPDVLPLGTRIYMNGHEYCVEDTGSGVEGNHIDVYVTDHQLAVNNGVASAEIFASRQE